MSFLVTALDQQIYQSIYAPDQSPERKRSISNSCERTKTIAAIITFATPVFTLCFPTIFTAIISLAVALIAYDLFNMADNLSDAVRHSAQGTQPDTPASHIEMLLERTLLTTHIYKRILA